MADKKTKEPEMPNTAEFNDGRDTARAGLPRDPAPWPSGTEESDHWHAGYDYETGMESTS